VTRDSITPEPAPRKPLKAPPGASGPTVGISGGSTGASGAQAGAQSPDPRAVLLDTISTTLNAAGYWLPIEGKKAVADAVLNLQERNRVRVDIAEAKARDLDGAADVAVRAIQLMNQAGAERDEARSLLELVREAVAIADPDDVTDWQRGYRACADRVLNTLQPKEQS
jgi:hypothetical protein